MTNYNSDPAPQPASNPETYLQIQPRTEAKVLGAAIVLWGVVQIAYGAFEAVEDNKPVFTHDIIEMVKVPSAERTPAEEGVLKISVVSLFAGLIAGHNKTQKEFAYWQFVRRNRRRPDSHEDLPPSND
ncbi:MAG TPA: hypothetical protein VF733_05300 [Candidatus Saccharimonadales bacterium]